MTTKPLKQGEMMVPVIDGLPAMRVRMKFRPTQAIPKSCTDKGQNHCARHGKGPFFCCVCGAEFKIVGDGT